MRSVVVLLGVFLGGCGVDGSVPFTQEPDAGMGPGPGMLPDASPALSDASRPTDTTAAQADRMPSQSADTRQADTSPPSVPSCPRTYYVHADRCGYLTASDGCGGYGWMPKWKDGLQCAICKLDGKQVTGCTSHNGAPNPCTGEPIPVICVDSCAECQ